MLRILKPFYGTAAAVFLALLLCGNASAGNSKTVDQTTTATVQVSPSVSLELSYDGQDLSDIENPLKEQLIHDIRFRKEQGQSSDDLWAQLKLILDRESPVGTLDQGTDGCPGTDLGSVLGNNIASGITGIYERTWGAFPARPACWQGQWFIESNNAFDVAYKWTAPFAGSFSFSLCGSNYDTGISLWNYTCGDHVPAYPGDFICGNDDDPRAGGCGATFQSYLECIQLTAGQQILVVVDGFDNASGSYTLSINECTDPCLNPQHCGAPAEVEPNNDCASANMQLDCSLKPSFYGVLCAPSSDLDFVHVIIAPMTVAEIRIADGDNCSVNPSNNVQMRAYSPVCQALTNSTRDFIRATNSGAENFEFLIRVARRTTNSPASAYRLYTANCCAISTCETAIEVPSGDWNGENYVYQSTFSTCCGLNTDRTVYDTGCSGTFYAAGPEVYHRLILSEATTVSISLFGARDNQLSVYSDCANWAGSCVGSADHAVPNVGGTELLENLYLEAGTYYVVSSLWSSNSADCGEVTLLITGDHQLAVELISFGAIPGNGQITLDWRTASESDLDHFEVTRDGATIAQIAAANRATGAEYSWTDNGLENGRAYSYGLVSVDFDGSRTNLGLRSASPSAAAGTVNEFALEQNYPNPFNAVTDITFDIPDAAHVTLSVYNLSGQRVATLVDETRAAGKHVVQFDGNHLATGVYIYRMQSGDFTAREKMVLLK